MRTFSSAVSRTACALACLLTLAFPALAAVRAYSAKGTAQFTGATTFVGSGQATHLGRYSESGTVAFSPTSDPAVFHIDGTITYTAANGDELNATASGELNTKTGAITATLTYTGGTGRFDDAEGTSTLTGQLAEGGSITVSVRGTIDY